MLVMLVMLVVMLVTMLATMLVKLCLSAQHNFFEQLPAKAASICRGMRLHAIPLRRETPRHQDARSITTFMLLLCLSGVIALVLWGSLDAEESRAPKVCVGAVVSWSLDVVYGMH